jgi:endonuclease-3
MSRRRAQKQVFPTASNVLDTLRARYQPPRTFLHYRTPLDLLVATILSAQCTDARVNIVTKVLYKKYDTAEDYVRVPRSELENDVHSCGTYRNKAKYIQEMSRLLMERHGGEVPQTMEQLTALPGVGRKTASIILWSCFGKNEGIAVDTHVLRVSRRLGLSTHADPVRVEKDLIKALPPTEWGTITTLLISLGRDVCTARDRNCAQCPFAASCPSSLERAKPDRAGRKTP